MPYAHYLVAREDKNTRARLAVVAEGLTMDAAGRLARQLQDAEGDDGDRFAVHTMPLADQIELAVAAGVLAALAEEEANAEGAPVRWLRAA